MYPAILLTTVSYLQDDPPHPSCMMPLEPRITSYIHFPEMTISKQNRVLHTTTLCRLRCLIQATLDFVYINMDNNNNNNNNNVVFYMEEGSTLPN